MNALKSTDRRKGLLAAILTATCWSFLALFLKFALKYSDSYSIVWYRMFVAFTVLFFWFLWENKTQDLKILTIKPGLMLIAALCLAFNYVGFMQGVHFTSPANAQVFIQLGPLLLAIAGLVVFKEKLTPLQKMGFIFCTLGFGLFFLDRLSMTHGSGQNFFLGLSWIIAGAITWAAFAIFQKKLLQQWNSSQINIYIYLVSTLVFIPFVSWESLVNLPIELHLFYIFLGLNTLVAYGSLSIALKYLPATQVSPIITMNPLFTLILINIIAFMDWNFIPADPVGLNGYLGAIIAIAGIIFIITKKRKT